MFQVDENAVPLSGDGAGDDTVTYYELIDRDRGIRIVEDRGFADGGSSWRYQCQKFTFNFFTSDSRNKKNYLPLWRYGAVTIDLMGAFGINGTRRSQYKNVDIDQDLLCSDIKSAFFALMRHLKLEPKEIIFIKDRDSS